jgi:hypothetical protein
VPPGIFGLPWPGGSESRGGGRGQSRGGAREKIAIRSSLEEMFTPMRGVVPTRKRRKR